MRPNCPDQHHFHEETPRSPLPGQYAFPGFTEDQRASARRALAVSPSATALGEHPEEADPRQRSASLLD